jgi:hypothetical protein
MRKGYRVVRWHFVISSKGKQVTLLCSSLHQENSISIRSQYLDVVGAWKSIMYSVCLFLVQYFKFEINKKLSSRIWFLKDCAFIYGTLVCLANNFSIVVQAVTVKYGAMYNYYLWRMPEDLCAVYTTININYHRIFI